MSQTMRSAETRPAGTAGTAGATGAARRSADAANPETEIRFGKLAAPAEPVRPELDRVLEETILRLRSIFCLEILRGYPAGLSDLSFVDTISLEAIHALDEPTVNEFAQFMGISAPNAAYKINRLIEKGCLEKKRSEEDRREYHLVPTQKYLQYLEVSKDFLSSLSESIRERFTPADCDRLEEVLRIFRDELLSEYPAGFDR